MAKIWNKGFDADKSVEKFTVGRDREFDLRLAKYDIIGSMAHIKMLVKIGLLEEAEEKKLRSELQRILSDVEEGISLSATTLKISIRRSRQCHRNPRRIGQEDPLWPFTERSGAGGPETLLQG